MRMLLFCFCHNVLAHTSVHTALCILILQIYLVYFYSKFFTFAYLLIILWCGHKTVHVQVIYTFQPDVVIFFSTSFKKKRDGNESREFKSDAVFCITKCSAYTVCVFVCLSDFARAAVSVTRLFKMYTHPKNTSTTFAHRFLYFMNIEC